MPGQEEVTFEIDPRSVASALGQMNADIDRYEKGATGANQRLQDSFERVSNLLLRMNDKQQDSNLRLVRANEMRAATYGREVSEVQRLIAQRDEYNKRLTGSEEAIRRNSAAFEQMISKAESSEGGGKFKEFGENVARFIEQPMMASRGAVTGLLESMGPIGGITAAAAAGLMAFAGAGYEAAKSVGEASARTRDMEIRMGVTDKQAAQLGFSAKAAGADVSVFERAMRGLTTAVEGTGTEGAKARQELSHFGVDIEGLKNGTAGTYETLIKISEGLRSMSSPFERNAAGMDIFKRAYFEMAPALLDLRENSEYFQQHGLPVWTDSDAKQGMEYLKWATSVEQHWENIKLHILDAVAGTAQFLAGGGGPKPSSMAEQTGADIAYDRQQAARERTQALAAPYVVTRDRERAAFAGTDQGIEDMLSAAKKRESETRAAYFGTEGVDPLRGASASDADKLAKAWHDARAELEKYKDQDILLKQRQKDAEEQARIPVGPMPSDFDNFSILRDQLRARNVPELAKAASEWKPESLHAGDEEFLKGMRRDTEQLTQSVSAIDKTLKFSRDAELSQQESAIRVGGILGGRDQSLITDRQITAAKKAALDDQYRFEMQEVDAVQSYITNADDRRMEIRMQHAKDVGELEMKLAEQVAQETRRQFDSIKSSATSLWETALNHPKDFGKQLRSTMHEAIVKPVAEGLGGLTAQVLQPIVYGADGHTGIAGMFKGTFGSFNKPLDPLNGALDTTAMAVRQSTIATIDLTGELRAMRSFGSGGGGGGSVSAASAPGGWGIPGFRSSGTSSMGGGYSNPGWGTNLFNPAVGGDFGGSGFGFPGAPGGTSGFAGPVFQTGTTASMPRGNNPFAGIFGGGSGAGGGSGIGGILGGFKNSWTGLGKSIGYNGQQGWTAGIGNGFGTVAESIATSPAAGTAGMMLSQAGIFGGSRGTWKGVGESTGGMALLGGSLGMQFGGPEGAAIGAAAGAVAGFGISMSEKLLGILSPQEKAKQDVKSAYGLNIDNQMAQQIVQMAQSKYANNIEVAVRSPEVRQMLGLYAAGTGQKMPLSATTPMGGSLAEQGGQLYQQATYQYGKSYSYGGNLPVLGGPTQGTVPNASQPLMMSVNIDGGNIQKFMNGTMFTPEATQSNLEAAWNSGNGRVSSSAAMQGVPNLIT